MLITLAMMACMREQSEISSSTKSVDFNLVKLTETDSTVSLALSCGIPIENVISGLWDIKVYRLNLSELLVSICPIVDSNLNFVTATLNGNSNTTLDRIITGTLVGSEGRGIRILPLVRNDSTLVEYHFTIKKGVCYLHYNSFYLDLCYRIVSGSGDPLKIKLKEDFAEKNIPSEMNQISILMDTSFTASNNFEITNNCGTITSSYGFYRNRPVKLLYYPL